MSAGELLKVWGGILDTCVLELCVVLRSHRLESKQSLFKCVWPACPGALDVRQHSLRMVFLLSTSLLTSLLTLITN